MVVALFVLKIERLQGMSLLTPVTLKSGSRSPWSELIQGLDEMLQVYKFDGCISIGREVIVFTTSCTDGRMHARTDARTDMTTTIPLRLSEPRG